MDLNTALDLARALLACGWSIRQIAPFGRRDRYYVEAQHEKIVVTFSAPVLMCHSFALAATDLISQMEAFKVTGSLSFYDEESQEENK